MLNRITNYNLLRCKLCVKFVLNGNGFHYGRAIASYIPLHNNDGFTKDRAFFQEDVVEASQRPHVYLDPTNSQGGTLCLPFVWPYNALDVPDSEWDDMGDIILHGMQNLKHANGASDSVTVSVFAWAEDVVFSTPTANEPGPLQPQAGEYIPQGDEYGQGVVSKPASIVARAAGALANAPVIGMYARATEIGANALSSIATAFGYSRPAIVDDIQSYKPTYLGNMTNTNVGDTCQKLTLDAKQELSCDTRTMGLDGTDEMTIKSIATRESYITKFPWAVADTTESLLWNTQVNPVIWNELDQGDYFEYHMPACCFAALPFKYWRGTMKYRFQIVASAFHKGRIKVTYDPSFPATNEYNTNYTRIIDLAEERDFTVEIGWGQQYSYLEHRELDAVGGEIFSTIPLGFDSRQVANGVLSVYVVNELTVPNSTADNDIEINVFVSAGDDFEVAVPDETAILNLSWFQPQFGEYVPQSGEQDNTPDSDNTTEENAPMRQTIDEHMAETDNMDYDHTNEVYVGDPITSIRQVLKRYNFSRAHAPGSSTGDRFVMHYINDLPQYRGYDPNGVDLAQLTIGIGTAAYNYSKQTFLNYFMPAYVCWRGNIRWKYHMNSDQWATKTFLSLTNDVTPNRSFSKVTSALLDNANADSLIARQWANDEPMPSTIEGTVITDAAQNPVVEAEIPFYRNMRFGYAKQSNLESGTGSNAFYHRLAYTTNVGTDSRVQFLGHVSVGEDFTLGWYMGPPVAYIYQNPLAAT